MLHFVIGLLIFQNVSFTGISNEKWQIERNDSVRVFYSDGYEDMAQRTLTVSTQVLEEFSIKLAIPYSGEVFVFLAPDEKAWQELTNGVVPDWSGGVTKPRQGITYLRVNKNKLTNTLPVLRHELIHLLISKNFEPSFIPRWFEEGLATYISNRDVSEFRVALSLANVSKSLIPLNEINNVLAFQKSKANLAYAQSYVAVKLIIESIGWQAVQQILHNGLQSKQWNSSFYSVLEMDEEEFELYLFEYIENHYRWNFLYQSDYVLWVLIPISVVLIYLIVRLRNYRTYRRWSAEEEGGLADSNIDEVN